MTQSAYRTPKKSEVKIIIQITYFELVFVTRKERSSKIKYQSPIMIRGTALYLCGMS